MEIFPKSRFTFRWMKLDTWKAMEKLNAILYSVFTWCWYLLHNLKNLTDRLLLYVSTGHEIRVQTILVKGRYFGQVALIKYQKDRLGRRLMIWWARCGAVALLLFDHKHKSLISNGFGSAKYYNVQIVFLNY